MLVGDTATSLLVGAVNYKPVLASTAVRLAWKKSESVSNVRRSLPQVLKVADRLRLAPV